MNKKLEKLKFDLAEEAAGLIQSLKEPTAEEVAMVIWAVITTWEEACAKPRKETDKLGQTKFVKTKESKS